MGDVWVELVLVMDAGVISICNVWMVEWKKEVVRRMGIK